MNSLSLLTMGLNRALKDKQARSTGIALIRPVRIDIVALTLFLSLTGVQNVWSGDATVRFEIPATRASQALNLFAHQADIQLLYPFDIIEELQLEALTGQYSVDEGIRQLVAGTCLEVDVSTKDSVILSANRRGFWFMKSKNCKKSSVLSALSAAVMSAIAAPSQAQGGDETSRPMALEEIVVTAQKRSENLQEVPISVTALSGDMTTASGIRSSEDLAMNVPGLTVTRTTVSGQIFLRGIGTDGAQAGIDSAIAVFVDGVYQPVVAGATFSLNNIERIEVLKGPQGTLYGRNATGGAISIITKTPSFEPTLDLELGYGNKDTREAKFYGATGLTDTIAADLSGFYHDQQDGFGKNVITGNETNKFRDAAVRAKLLYDGGGDLRATLSADYSKMSGSLGMSQRPGDTTFSPLMRMGNANGYWDTESNVDGSLYVENMGGSARIEYDFNDIVLTSITAYRELDTFQDGDLDLVSIPLVRYPLTEQNRQITQEFQLGATYDDISWTVGAFYLTSTAEYAPFQLLGLAFASDINDGIGFFATQETTSYALYGQTTFAIGDKTNLTLGARYTEDEREHKDVSAFAISGGQRIFLANSPDRSTTFDKPTWRIALDHQLTDELMIFGSISRGFKSGVYNMVEPSDPVVKPEVLDAYELGFKSTLFDHRMRLNASAFYYQYDDIQLTRITTTTQLFNAASADVFGLDVDIEALITENLTIHGGLSWLPKAEYSDFPDAPYMAPDFQNGGNAVTAGDASGNRMVRAPKSTFSLAINHNLPLANGELNTNISYMYNDGFYWTPNNRPEQDAYSLVNAQILWNSPDEKYLVRLFAKNLFDKKYISQMSEVNFGDTYSPAAGRTYGIAFGYRL
ncbi:MAG: TonB-dependent receptor [Porticoccaceae bacterium]